MSRIEKTFADLKRESRRGFIPFITAGDPDLKTTRVLIVELARVGATVIELGVPFSDPMADGPVIQRASERALRHGFGMAEILEMVAGARKQTDVPIVLFSYFNPLLQFCANKEADETSALPAFRFEKLAGEAKMVGVDGVLVTDLAPEEASEFAATLRAHEIDMIFLVAPTSTDARLHMVAERASGFIYAVSRAGVTGAREEMSAEAERLVTRVRQFSDLPVAVGFGISKPEHVADVWRYADAAVVGSAIVAEVEKLQGDSEMVSKTGRFTKQLMPDQIRYS
ncbi:MAG TPA: tryptophan synthase subunit alpha [Pyrinomonadaceae bacterium]|nr:tryptophan synthase subunit alpha [Pyrinomonadaceae bacterium]